MMTHTNIKGRALGGIPYKERKKGASASASPSPMKGAGLIPGEEVKRVESKGSTPESVASPSIACLGWD